MSVLQKSVLDVRFQGMDEKTNPRTAIPATILDGLNWQMLKDQQIQKRTGLLALALLDDLGTAITGARELSSHGDELLLSTRQKIYGRDSASGQWIQRGVPAYERLDMRVLSNTLATCNGIDSRLQADSATIGDFLLTVMTGGNAPLDTSASHWVLTSRATGQALPQTSQGLPSGLTEFSLGTDGHTGYHTGPTFVAFGAVENTLMAGVWDNSTSFGSVAWTTLVTDLDTTAVDPNTYTLQPVNARAYSYSIVRVGDNVWLLAYLQAGHNWALKKITRSTGTSFTVSAAVVLATSGTANAACFAWAYKDGDTNAHLAITGGGQAGDDVLYYSVPVAFDDTPWLPQYETGSTGWQYCRAATAIMVGTVPTYFFDAIVNGVRSVYIWQPVNQATHVPSLLMRGAGLLTHAFVPPGAVVGSEIGLGIAYPSEWQPSTFLYRMFFSGTDYSTWQVAIGAHLQAGDFAGCPMGQQLPRFESGAALPISTLGNPVSLGGAGTALVSIATLTASAYTSVAPPASLCDITVLPGALLKAYDGDAVTEAAFALGPERVQAVESGTGQIYNVDPLGVLTAESVSAVDGQLTATFNPTTQVAMIQLESAVGGVGLTSWPAGAAQIYMWVKILNPTPGATYELGAGGEGAPPFLWSSGYGPWQNEPHDPVALTSSWQRCILDLSVQALPAEPHDRLIAKIWATSVGDAGATLCIAVGNDMPAVVSTPLPVMESGQRQYCACAVWTDHNGRTQRSQICPAVTMANVAGLANTVTVPMLHLTERLASFGTSAVASIEFYRTLTNSPTFYRIATFRNVANGADTIYRDAAADTDIDGNEELYTTGGVVENWPPIGCNLVASHQGRLFVVTSDNQVLFTAYSQSGEGLAFAAEYQVEAEYIPSMTALLSLDDKLVMGSATSYAVLTGVGPESTGLPAYDSPMLISSGVGPTSQRGCARTPDGIVMGTAHGIQMIDRGLSLQMIGVAIAADTLATPWYTAAYHPTAQQVRLSTDSHVWVQDISLAPTPNRVGQWFKWSYCTTLVAMATAAGVLYGLGANGYVYQVDVGYDDGGAAYQEYVQLAVVAPAGPLAWGRIYQIAVACDVALGTAIQLQLVSDDGAYGTDEPVLAASSGGLQHVRAKPRFGKCSDLKIWIGEQAATATAGVTIESMALLVGNKGGLGRLPVTHRMARST